VNCAKTAEPFEMPFGLWTRMGLTKEGCIMWGAYWRHLANTVEPSICCGDACGLFVKLLWPRYYCNVLIIVTMHGHFTLQSQISDVVHELVVRVRWGVGA